MTMAEAVAEAAGDVGAETATDERGVTEYRRDGLVFAAVGGETVEVHLHPEIAEAALNTPATSASDRGAGWVRLAPAAPTENDADRAKAWFLSAWRNAAK